MRFLSPLRYPGGKAGLAPFVGQMISRARPRPRTYVEPFAGGAGVALRLLFDEYVETVVLNDLDPGIAAFWRAVFESTDEFVSMLRAAEVSVDAWHGHREIYETATADDLELGFATFFLNRTNRSGILNARPIGGLDQTGKWLIDARFNRDSLADRIRTIARYRNRIDVRQRHALRLIDELEDRWESLFVYADPPYLDHGDSLYMDAMSWEDHQTLARRLSALGGQWMVTYDCDSRVLDSLYPSFRCAEFGIAHTAAKQHIGHEFVVFSDAIPVDDMVGVGAGEARWIEGRGPR